MSRFFFFFQYRLRDISLNTIFFLPRIKKTQLVQLVNRRINLSSFGKARRNVLSLISSQMLSRYRYLSDRRVRLQNICYLSSSGPLILGCNKCTCWRGACVRKGRHPVKCLESRKPLAHKTRCKYFRIKIRTQFLQKTHRDLFVILIH